MGEDNSRSKASTGTSQKSALSDLGAKGQWDRPECLQTQWVSRKAEEKSHEGRHFTTFLLTKDTHALGLNWCKGLYFAVPAQFSLILSFKTRKTKGMALPVFHSASTKLCFQMLRNQQFPTFRLHKSQGVHQLIARNGNRNSQEMLFQKLI